ncbi:hypothetical protein C9374_005461 [Naegleria lovaniensis]|uniref:Short-chain dehydrogenase/reductase 3 n=1 Tax=Naegleria lovaniensis TaxID=51637 RepID=A0AA88GJR6_NAELO|nr:uncharacterized protein C9374_005461 [Naegleria lovaniensis]KAG2382259.1 hypothetical protein C9374_005461 [Naegleria lovaniensis]
MFTISTIIFFTILYNIYWYFLRKEKSLKGKNVLITGGSRGIGRLVAEILLSKEQVNCIVIWDVDQNSLQECQSTFSKQYGQDRIITCQVDISDHEKVYRERDNLYELFKNRKLQNPNSECSGSIDILINNAGIVNGKPLLQTSDDRINMVLNVNTISHCYTVKAFLPEMIKNQNTSPHIVTIASAAALCGTSSLCDYSASKFGAFGFNEALRLEMKHLKYNIDTTCVCPFYIRTDLFAGIKDVIPYLFPVLDPNYVANRIVQGIKKREEVVVIPEMLRITYLLRFLLPVSVFDRLVSWMGISSSMDHFIGRKSSDDTTSVQSDSNKKNL